MKDDTISRQAALDAIGNVPDHDDGMVFEALSHAQRDVALLPSAQPEQRWIPCSERLPTKPGRYLVTQKRPYGMYVTTAYFDLNEFFDEAVAWMSPPEPYRGEGGNA